MYTHFKNMKYLIQNNVLFYKIKFFLKLQQICCVTITEEHTITYLFKLLLIVKFEQLFRLMIILFMSGLFIRLL